MRIQLAKCFVAMALAIASASCGNESQQPYINATIGTLNTLAQAAQAFRESSGREVSTSYVSDFRANIESMKIINRLQSGFVTTSAVLDGWGNAIVFNPATPGTPAHFRSAGPDGVMGNADDVTLTP